MKSIILFFGNSPWKPLTIFLFLNAITVGMDWILSWAANCWFSSILILASVNAPLDSLTTSSIIGLSCLQGPHQGAQKSAKIR